MGFMDKLKSGFDTAVQKTGELADKAVKKGGEVAESAKLTLNLKNEEAKLAKLFGKLGMLAYEKAADEEMAAVIVEIDDTKAAIAALKAEIMANSGKMLCTACGKELEAGSQFCQFCGAKLEQPAPAEVVEEVAEAVEETVEEAVEAVTDAAEAVAETVAETVEEIKDAE